MSSVFISGEASATKQDRSSLRLAYILIALEFAVSIAAALAFGFRTSTPLSFLPQMWCVGLVICGPLARRIGYDRLAGSTETVGLLYAQSLAVYALLYPLTAVARPFADDELAAADRLLGFDWPSLASYVAAHPLALNLMIAAYFSFMVQGCVILPLLFYRGLGERAWKLILAANIAVLICVLIYPLAPAAGAFVHYGIGVDDYPFIPFRIPWSFGPVIEAIRDHGDRLITRDLLTSFVSFPSFHASAAFLFAWAMWPFKLIRWPALALNIGMGLSALIIGGHYLVDLIGGVAVGFVGLLLASEVIRR